jgi:GNAT superfamily N-acetyltransferase
VSWTLRRGGVADADAIDRVMTEAFEGYRAFAPPGWRPPGPGTDRTWLGEMLARPDVWCLVADAGHDRHAGHVAIMPATLARRPSSDTRLAHFWQLFVRPRHWGSGLAVALHDEALAEAARRGFTAIRLFTPAGQARARRFYERAGWTAAAAPFEESELGLALVEYRRPLA